MCAHERLELLSTDGKGAAAAGIPEWPSFVLLI